MADNDAQILIRLPRALLQRIDALAKAKSRACGLQVKRATFVRMLIESAAAREEKSSS